MILILRVPYVKISSAEIFLDQYLFRFYLKPYYLNLNFKQKMAGEEPETAVYDHNTYEITLKCRKAVKGESYGWGGSSARLWATTPLERRWTKAERYTVLNLRTQMHKRTNVYSKYVHAYVQR